MQAGGTARPLRGQFHVHYSYPALPAAPAGGAAVQQGCLQRHRVSSRPGPGGGGVLGLAAGLGPLAGSGWLGRCSEPPASWDSRLFICLG